MTLRRVAAVVLTYTRATALAETLRAARAQTRPPDRLYVVDNAGDDKTATLLRDEFPDAVHLPTGENLGVGGRTYGIQAAREDGFEAFWIVDDDSPPLRGALEALLSAAERSTGRVAMVGSRGGVVRFGLIRHVDDVQRLTRRRVGTDLFAVDFVLQDGSLLLGGAVDAIGLPRADYFLMMEDVEYPLRARRAGFEVLLVDRDLVQRRHLGSTRGTGVWRGYYQSRNHVRMALDFRSPSLLFGCLVRQIRFFIAALMAPDRRWERVKVRWRGISDGFRNRMGRNVEPDPGAR
jgi:rhamnopyranosyl-N-acetylglucosaminyl-diphospho-decaprenol beta-1,3/1,4-galactofuranosyltransferase